MKKYLPFIGIIRLVALACFIRGAAMVYYDSFLFRLLNPSFLQIVAFRKGHPADKRSHAQRFRDELIFDPFTFAVNPSPFLLKVPLSPVDTSKYSITLEFTTTAQRHNSLASTGVGLYIPWEIHAHAPIRIRAGDTERQHRRLHA